MSKVIIEGMDPNNTGLNFVIYKFNIRPKVNSLLLEFYNSQLFHQQFLQLAKFIGRKELLECGEQSLLLPCLILQE